MRELLPYLMLLVAVVVSWFGSPRVSLIALVVVTLDMLTSGYASPIGVGWILIAGLLLLSVVRLGAWTYFAFGAVALGLMLHLLPGFNNLKVLDHVHITPDAAPFSMYLNFDKTAVAVLLFGLFLRSEDLRRPRWGDLALVAITGVVLCLVMMPLALGVDYVGFALKTPDVVWAVNNLFFVCYAEEAFCRGFVQGGLARLKLPRGVPLLAGALIFGLLHYTGGPLYVLLATICGLFYGFVYMRTGRISVPILLHFGFNLVHFTFFTYPSLQI